MECKNVQYDLIRHFNNIIIVTQRRSLFLKSLVFPLLPLGKGPIIPCSWFVSKVLSLLCLFLGEGHVVS